MEKVNYDSQKVKYENFQRSMNEYRNKQKELENNIGRREKIKAKIMNMTLNIKKRDFTREMQDI